MNLLQKLPSSDLYGQSGTLSQNFSIGMQILVSLQDAILGGQVNVFLPVKGKECK